jgi:GxxExxY protein
LKKQGPLYHRKQKILSSADTDQFQLFSLKALKNAERISNMEDLTYKIRGCIFEVFKELGPGLLESVYEAALVFELVRSGLSAQSQVPIPVFYKSVRFELGFRLDILVENQVVIEIKSVETLHDVHKKQLLTYLKLTGKKLGILVNFNSSHLIDKESLIRIANNY